MKSGSYYRIGKYNVWYGCQGDDVNLLRIEWIGDARKVHTAKIDPVTIVAIEREGVTTLKAKTTKGALEIFSDSNGNVVISYRRGFITTLKVKGTQGAYRSDNLISKIVATNSI